MAQAYIALGSNLGKRQAALRAALSRIEQIPATKLHSLATFRETIPVDAPPLSTNFINSVALLKTDLTPQELLLRLLKIECDLGRDRQFEAHHGPRTIDLDLLLYDDLILSTPDLQLPHPRMHLRAFVLEPLNEIAPDLVHPLLKKTIAQLWTALQNS